MAAWPVGADLMARLNRNAVAAVPSPEATADHHDAVAAAHSRITEVINIDSGATDIPDAIRQAVLIEAHRLYRRVDTPEGVLSFGDSGTYISRIDGDVQNLIRPWLKTPLGFA